MELFEMLHPNATPEDRARHEAAVAEVREHMKFRRCSSGCGCSESFDDRKPDLVTGGFGVAGCDCPRCNGVIA